MVFLIGFQSNHPAEDKTQGTCRRLGGGKEELADAVLPLHC